jgi:CubicO group peptidase (beta-lactamase class C family)
MDRRSLLVAAGATVFTGCVAALSESAAAAGAASLPFASELDDLIEDAMRHLAALAGLTVAVYSRDGVYTRGFGVTDVTTGERADANTAFYIASSTKPLTALVLSAMAERGEIDLAASLAAFAPNAPFPAAVRADTVTFRHLLAHTSGISCDPIAFRLAYSGQHDPDQLWRLLAASDVDAQAPIGTFNYTNTGYNIATVLTDRHFGRPWQDMLDREIFRPTGMRHATARISRARSGRWSVAKPHTALPEGITNLYLEKTDQTMHSAGGVVMSANDAVRWLELMIETGAIGGRRMLPAASVLATRTPITTLNAEYAGYKREAYGLGWYHGPYRDERMLHHFGGFPGARAHVSYIPARHIGVAAFANDSSVAAQLTDAVANYVYDRTAGRKDALTAFNTKIGDLIARRDRFYKRVMVERTERAKRKWNLTRPSSDYAGSYENENFGRIEIVAEDNGLCVNYGVMHANAEPFTTPDTIYVELMPSSGEPIAFEGPAFSTLRYDTDTYSRV